MKPEQLPPNLATPEGARALLLGLVEATAAAPAPERYDNNARTAAHRLARTARNLVARATEGAGAERYAPALLRSTLAAGGWVDNGPELGDARGRNRLEARRDLVATLRRYNAAAYEAGRNTARVLARLHAEHGAREARAEAEGAEAAAAASEARARAVEALGRRAEAYADRIERLLLAGRRRDALALVETEGPRLLGLARELGADPVALGLE